MNCELTLSNHNRDMRRIMLEPVNSSSFDRTSSAKRITDEIESSLVSTTFQNIETQEITNLLNKRKMLVKQRNTLLASTIKRLLLPSYKKKLNMLDSYIDTIDMQIYLLESENRINERDINKLIQVSYARVAEHSQYLSKK